MNTTEKYAIKLSVVSALSVALVVSACSAKSEQSHGTASPSDSPIDGMRAFAAQITGQEKLDDILSDLNRAPSSEIIKRLRSLRNHPAISQTAKSEAAYVLARQLIKVKDKGAASADVNGEIKALFEEAAKLQALAERSYGHIVTLAKAQTDEMSLREALGQLRTRATLAETRAFCDYTAGQSCMRTNETDTARQFFLSARKEAPGTNFQLGSAYYLAELALKSNTAEGNDEALSLFREYLNGATDGRFAGDIADRMTQLNQSGQFKLMAADHEKIGNVRYHQKRWHDAIAAWDTASPDTNLFLRSICLMHLGKHPEAKAMLVRAISKNPESKFYASAATILGNPLSKAQTLDLWKAALSANPKHADAALWNMAIRLGPPQSTAYFNEILKRFPTSQFAPESAWWLFWHDVKSGDVRRFPAAVARAQAHIERYPTTKAASRLLFWCGKLSEKTGRPSDALRYYKTAAQRFPAYYYGFRAQHRINAISKKSGDQGWSTSPARKHPRPAWHWPDPALSASEAETEQKIGPTFQVLSRLRQFDECLELAGNSLPARLKAWMLAGSERPLEAINAATRDLHGGAQETSVWQFSYPLVYSDMIAQNASQKHVDPVLVHALIREESRYNPAALSRSNAIGLMQLLPGTAYGVAKRLGVPLASKEDVFKPEVNIKLGTDYLSYAVRRFGGNALLGVASYNGGPGAVSAWMKRHQASSWQDYDVFVENIPYRETRDYVRKVFGSYWTYLCVYGKPELRTALEHSAN